jgi:hypothetical protein
MQWQRRALIGGAKVVHGDAQPSQAERRMQSNDTYLAL